jgi:regulator of sirC expression with transglutaminase-like and TPR domain
MQFIETSVSEAFSSEVIRSESEINLAKAGLIFARSEYPQLDTAWYLGQLDLIAGDISARLDPHADLNRRLQIMNTYLFSELGYSGNFDDYYDPRNSFLNEVIDRRIGLPITLSILFLELAQRIGIDAKGVSFPGHFLIAVAEQDGDVIVDAFDGGAVLARSTFVQRLLERAEPNTKVETLEAALRPASKSEILLRQLRNLKAIYVDKGLVEKTLNTINHMLVIHKDLLPELLERAALYDSLGYARGAVVDYERALPKIPAGPQKAEVQSRLAQARQQAQKLH